MPSIGFREASYIKKYLSEVKHITLDPGGNDVLRIHMIPPRSSHDHNTPCVIIVNGQDIVPISLSWAILLSAFIDAITPFDGQELPERVWDKLIRTAILRVKRVYPTVKQDTLRSDLWTIISALTDVARGRKPQTDIGCLSLGEYAVHMKAPHRMDLMISAMTHNGAWNCNQRCLHCYAAGQPLSSADELSTSQWKAIIDKCKNAGIPQLTFTGGEPTLRSDLIELVEHSRWFITRLNTNGVLLTPQLCERLCKASLDSVQVTLYSADSQAHNRLVGADNWSYTVQGIKNALNAILNVSINTPLCTLNSNYVATLKLAHELGVRFASCSGLIVTGGASGEESIRTQLSSLELFKILTQAQRFCTDNHMELSFTSPGWVSENLLFEAGIYSAPSCGAALSNMAVTPDGQVIPCQSWLSDDALGSMLTDDWSSIWDNPRCRQIRARSARMDKTCPLRPQSEVTL